jgi:hypothetical protein
MRRPILIGLLVLLGAALAAPLRQPAAAQKGEAAPAQKRADYELRIIRVGNTFQGVRFKVSSGEAWLMAGSKYEKIPETGPIPAGDYDIALITDDTNWMAFRIDRLTGATWQLRNNKWNKVKEPEEKAP